MYIAHAFTFVIPLLRWPLMSENFSDILCKIVKYYLPPNPGAPHTPYTALAVIFFVVRTGSGTTYVLNKL